jgi:hypothetical protein
VITMSDPTLENILEKIRLIEAGKIHVDKAKPRPGICPIDLIQWIDVRADVRTVRRKFNKAEELGLLRRCGYREGYQLAS